MAKTYRIQSTISTSNAIVEIIKNGVRSVIDMNVRLTASVVKTKAQYFCLGRLFSQDVTIGATGSGTISVYEMYRLFGDDLKYLLAHNDDSDIKIKATVKSDDLEYNQRVVIFEGVVFDQLTLFQIDELNAAAIQTIPFTFGGLDFIEDFDTQGNQTKIRRKSNV